MNTAKGTIEKELKCTVDVIHSEKSSEQKAKQTLPGKPAYMVR